MIIALCPLSKKKKRQKKKKEEEKETNNLFPGVIQNGVAAVTFSLYSTCNSDVISNTIKEVTLRKKKKKLQPMEPGTATCLNRSVG